MWPFSRKQPEGRKKTRSVMRKLIVGFVIGGAISSIIGSKLIKERRKFHLGEDREQ